MGGGTQARVLCIVLGFAILTGCATRPPRAAACVPSSVADVPAGLACETPTQVASLTGELTAVQQTRHQTRTVGVPRAFLVVMLVLMLVLAA